MSELIMVRGLPASGKSSWARAWVAADPEHRARVNQDDIRKMLSLGEWSSEKEQRVRAVRNAAIGALLRLGLSVVSDDTNLARRPQSDLRHLAFVHHVPLVDQDLTGVPLEECLRRDAAREDGVGEDVIRNMHDKYLKEA